MSRERHSGFPMIVGDGIGPVRAGFGAADWLGLAAAPTFAVMALSTWLAGSGMDQLCATGTHGWPFDGMLPMYLAMSAFHLPPWLKLAARRTGRRPEPVGEVG
jgi:hypothetical protein